MTTDVRPELSEKNKYWINKHRFYELRHFCLQYPTWKKAYESLDSLASRPNDLALISRGSHRSDPTLQCVLSRERFAKKIEMVENAVEKADAELKFYILKGVTEGLSYEQLSIKFGIPCSRDTYYNRYRKFFWILSKLRD